MYYMRGSVPAFRGLLLDRTNGTQGAVVPVPSRHQYVSPTRVFHVPPSFHPYHYRFNEGRENRLLYDKALEGLRQWNKDPNFYTGYAKNYISKFWRALGNGIKIQTSTQAMPRTTYPSL